ncbi:MAG: ATP-binding cassette domain-containing protein, partial [Lachnospiraceae bacterium]|nr:ATP-binding cassette domain-containing protein [Lachnospiraceae bacterium]
PTSMLDPIAARSFWELVLRLHREYDIRFIVAAHDTEYIYDYADAVYTLQAGTVVTEEHYNSLPEREKIRRHGRGYTEEEISAIETTSTGRDTVVIETLQDIRGSYDGQPVLAIRKLEIHQGINAWIGPNGAGKSTLAKVLAGYFGKKKLPNVVMMPQDVLTIFTKETVRQELDVEADIPPEIEELCGDLMDRHPLDLSGGEQHLVAVCKFLLKHADYLILDEPTKGVDYRWKKSIEKLLQEYAKQQTVIVITHDLELVGDIAEYVVFLFYGSVASMGEPHQVFGQNLFYKPYISRLNSAFISKEELE